MYISLKCTIHTVQSISKMETLRQHHTAHYDVQTSNKQCCIEHTDVIRLQNRWLYIAPKYTWDIRIPASNKTISRINNDGNHASSQGTAQHIARIMHAR